MDKKETRRAVRERVKALSAEEKAQKSTMLALALVVHPAVRSAGVVALFSPLSDEPQVGEIIPVIAGERSVVLPRVEGDVMRFYPYSPASMGTGSYGIQEPLEGEAVDPSSIDVMVVPGVAFTADGARLGRGKGYYDKYMSLPGFRARTLGVCYSQQLLEELPVDGHDVKIDEIINR